MLIRLINRSTDKLLLNSDATTDILNRIIIPADNAAALTTVILNVTDVFFSTHANVYKYVLYNLNVFFGVIILDVWLKYCLKLILGNLWETMHACN